MQIKIIIIDDDVEWIKILTKNLEVESDFNIIGWADNFKSAESLIDSTEFDIGIVDLSLSPNSFEGIWWIL